MSIEILLSFWMANFIVAMLLGFLSVDIFWAKKTNLDFFVSLAALVLVPDLGLIWVLQDYYLWTWTGRIGQLASSLNGFYLVSSIVVATSIHFLVSFAWMDGKS